jgi:hypothetical protein
VRPSQWAVRLATRLPKVLPGWGNEVEGCPLHHVELPLLGTADFDHDEFDAPHSSRLHPEFPRAAFSHDEAGNPTSRRRMVMEFDMAPVLAAPILVAGGLDLL